MTLCSARLQINRGFAAFITGKHLPTLPAATTTATARDLQFTASPPNKLCGRGMLLRMNESKTINPPVKTINAQQFDRLMQGAIPDSSHDNLQRLVRMHDGQLAKAFECGRFFSSNWWRPPSGRFVAVANELQRRGIHSADITQRYRLIMPKRDIVTYIPLEGIDLRQALRESNHAKTIFNHFITFLVELHHKGIYFRGIHFGNVIVMPDDQFGLVDVVSTRFFNRPLTMAMRARNFRHFFQYRLDKDVVREFGREIIMQIYLDHAKLDSAKARKLQAAVARL
jgi:hypothetical protein